MGTHFFSLSFSWLAGLLSSSLACRASRVRKYRVSSLCFIHYDHGGGWLLLDQHLFAYCLLVLDFGLCGDDNEWLVGRGGRPFAIGFLVFCVGLCISQHLFIVYCYWRSTLDARGKTLCNQLF